MTQVVFQVNDMARLPHYKRAEDPPNMRFSKDRDRAILEAIHQYEGLLTDDQLQHPYFGFFTSPRSVKRRMRQLYDARYVDRFSRQQRNTYSFMAYFLGEAGIEYLCGLYGVSKKELRPRLKKERTNLIRHDVKLNTVRLEIMASIEEHPDLALVEWLSARHFKSSPDTITFRNANNQKQSKRMEPDGFIHMTVNGKHRRYLLEYDRGFESNPAFFNDKVLPGIAYVSSQTYARRFRTEPGHGLWLVVTQSEVRRDNMKYHAERAGRAGRAFFYTTHDEAVEPGAFFFKPIWHRATVEKPVALFPQR